MPDAQAASLSSLVASGRGGIEGAVTSQAFTAAEAKTLFERAGQLVDSYQPMGAA